MVNKKLKRVNEKSVLFAVFIVLAILALGSLFIVKPKITGFVVIEGYENQVDCEGAGYTWEILTEENCTEIPDCVECVEGCLIEGEICEVGCVESYTEILCEVDCEETCEVNETGCVICEVGCVEEYTEILCAESCVLEEDLCEEECQETCQDCEDIIIGEQCVGDICDSAHLSLCLDETTCTGATGYWYDDVCNAAEECVSDCSGLECGDDGCGESCGTCDDGYSCDVGICQGDDDASSDDDTSSDEETPNRITGEVSSCVSNWECEEWTACIDNTQTRGKCIDTNNCVIPTDVPSMSIPCVSLEVTPEPLEILETCSDGIKNQDEKAIDCGGVCEQRCSFFTIIGNAVNVPINSSKQFVQNNKVISFSILGVIVLAISWIVCVKVFLKKQNIFFFLKGFHLPKSFSFLQRKKEVGSNNSNL